MQGRDPERLERLAAIFTFFAADGLDPYQSLVAHFEAGRMLGDSEFPFPPRDFEAAPEAVQQAWDGPWAVLCRKILEEAEGLLEKGELSRSDFNDLNIPVVAKELWELAVEKVERHFTPCVQPAGKVQLTVINGGKAPTFSGV